MASESKRMTDEAYARFVVADDLPAPPPSKEARDGYRAFLEEMQARHQGYIVGPLPYRRGARR